MSIARVRSITFNITRMADAFEADFSKVGQNYVLELEHALSIRTDDLTCLCISIYPDTTILERGADQMANFVADYGLSDTMLDNFFLTGTCTKFVQLLRKKKKDAQRGLKDKSVMVVDSGTVWTHRKMEGSDLSS